MIRYTREKRNMTGSLMDTLLMTPYACGSPDVVDM